MTAVWQGFGEVHVAPAVQAMQAWLDEQTMFVPQLLPAGWKTRSVQTSEPEPHSMVASRTQGSVEVQVAPCLQMQQPPPVYVVEPLERGWQVSPALQSWS
jgi:hypothetical protein